MKNPKGKFVKKRLSVVLGAAGMFLTRVIFFWMSRWLICLFILFLVCFIISLFIFVFDVL